MKVIQKNNKKLLSVSVQQGRKITHVGVYPNVETQERVKLICKEWYPGCVILTD